MATSSSFLSEDQFLCSICLEVFTEPVSIPCGHNFCKACLSRYWAGREQCQCPLCNEKFNKGLKLCINTGFREVVENFKKHHVASDSAPSIKPGQVPCDCCLDKKVRASKTCLVCLASFCETHLEPHRRVDALKRHKLTNPVHKLEDKICKEHNRIFEFFCRNDNTRICVLCTEHGDHDTGYLQEEYVDKRAQMGKKKSAVQETQHIRGKNKRKNARGATKANRRTSNQLLDPVPQLYSTEDPHFICGCSYIPQDRSFSQGRFCYEVRTKGRAGWVLGIVRESMREVRTFTPNYRAENWIIRLGNNRNTDRVLVFVDFENGLVSFFDVENAILMYSFTGCQFNERMFLCFCPGPPEDVSAVQRLRRSLRKISESSNELSCFIAFIFMTLAVLWTFYYLLLESS
ncbi:E3 ubiquitin-protein ligase TRIM39-like [Leuresthes tenuis]|uniref:E3 ubiquitin-protein ligase TRIM39-like n=1 Tax=Leuresthes tenuis TaxID=355514 RepID=UPI003B508A2B